MKLKKVSINLKENESNNSWDLDSLLLTDFNLLVGKNSTGKTRIIAWFESFVSTLKDYTFSDGFSLFDMYSETKFKLDFETESGILSYIFSTITKDLDEESDEQPVNVYEKIIYLGKTVLDRTPEETIIYSFLQNKTLKISPPDDKLVIHVRRDKEEFPFLENIALWAAGVFIYSFNNENDSVGNFYPTINKLNNNTIKKIEKDLSLLGYGIQNILIKDDITNKGKNKELVFIEKGLNKSLLVRDLSQGIRRTFDVLTLVEELLQSKKTTIIAIDNLCEGLDYERATKLGKLLIEKLENSNIQLIATSNDSFLMDVIPIKYWNILEREGNTVKSYNYQNSKEAFDAFKMSGLSNFYLFSSDFLHQKL